MTTIGILTISDKGFRGERVDKSGEVIRRKIAVLSGKILKYEIIPDEQKIIKNKLIDFADRKKIDLIITTGGTGLSPRDVTPEATLEVIDKEVPGIPQIMRFESLKKTPHAMISRAIAGIRGQSLIINLPGSPKAVDECLEIILPILIERYKK